MFGFFDGATPRTKVFTCLSHDIVVHGTDACTAGRIARAGAWIHRHPDQAAFHEGFADVIALLSVFSQVRVVQHLLLGEHTEDAGTALISRAEVSEDALRRSALFGLAEQMGSELRRRAWQARCVRAHRTCPIRFEGHR